MSEYFHAFLFLVVYEIMSWPLRLATAPIAMAPDVRRLVSRVAGPPIVVLAAWLGAHFGIPLGATACWAWWGLFLLIAWLVANAFGGARPDLRVLLPFDPPGGRRDWLVEGTSLFVFYSFLWFRRWNPEMTTTEINGAGAEKFDNAMFFWSSWHATTLPPEDYWLAGNRLPYYYFGHFFWAWIGRAGGFPGEWVITLGLSRVVLLIWEATYLLIRAFGLRPRSAAIGAFLLAWGGNPHAVKMTYRQYNDFVGRAAEAPEDRSFPFHPRYLAKFTERNDKGELVRKWDFYEWGASGGRYWDAAHGVFMTRTGQRHTATIVEHPSWSAIHGDFHAHHLTLPWTAGLVALIVAGPRWFRFRSRVRDEEDAGDEASPRGPPRVYGYAVWAVPFVAVGVAGAIGNVWIVPVTLAASFGLLFWRLRWGTMEMFTRLALILFFCLAVVGCWKLELGNVSREDTKVMRLSDELKSNVSELFGHWGFFGSAILAGTVLFLFSRRGRDRAPILSPAVWLCLGFSALCVLLKLTVLRNEAMLWWIAVAGLLAPHLLLRRPWFPPMATWILLATCGLLAGIEVFYISDGMGGLHQRYNTYFKHAMAIWPILGGAAFVFAHRLWNAHPSPLRPAIRAVLLATIPLVLTMTIFGAPNRLRMAQIADKRPRTPTLDAFAWLQYIPGYEAEHRMLAWIRKNVPPGDRVAEALNYSSQTIGYKYGGRVASLAGRPIPVGWEQHIFTWRGGGASEPVAANRAALDAFYKATTPEAMREAARKLGIRWAVFGKVEREQLRGMSGDPRNSDAVLQTMLKAGEVAAMFPRHTPTVFVVRFPGPGDAEGGAP